MVMKIHAQVLHFICQRKIWINKNLFNISLVCKCVLTGILHLNIKITLRIIRIYGGLTSIKSVTVTWEKIFWKRISGICQCFTVHIENLCAYRKFMCYYYFLKK